MIEGQNEADEAVPVDAEKAEKAETRSSRPPAKKMGSGTSDPLIGKVIHDRFRIIAPIARGGMGAVYRAEQAPLGRLVAIKVLSPKHDEEKDPEFRKRFFLEAATVAKLSHPNTVTVFDYGQSEGLFFIVMELLEGVTLKKELKRAGPLPAARAVHITKQICRSLREAHRLGVIHRDMKPGNVMLLEQGDEKDYVKVLDFGLVKDIDKEDDDEDLTQAGVFMGSPKYMSPEQIQGDDVDGRSDIYSLGVLLYEMLMGKPPFKRDKQVQVLMDHINTPPPPMELDEGYPPVPPELQQVVMKSLAKKREDRFDDMEQFLIALKMTAGELSLQMPASGEMGLTGEFPIPPGGTPVSGIHSLNNDPMRTSSSGSISAPNLVSSSGPQMGVPASTSQPMTVSSSQSLEQTSSGNKIVMVLGALALVAAAAIVFFVVDPFGGDETTQADTPPVADPPDPIADPDPEALGTAGQNDTETEPETQPETGTDPQPEPVEIATLLVELDSNPPGATVRIGDRTYRTPAQVELSGELAEPGTELELVFSRAGYRDETVTRTVPEEGSLELNPTLRRVWRPRRSGSSRSSGDDEEETPQRDVTLPGYRDTPY